MQTLEAFLREANLSPDAGVVGKDDLTIEKILEEKKAFDINFNFEKLNVQDGSEGWSLPGALPGLIRPVSSSHILDDL